MDTGTFAQLLAEPLPPEAFVRRGLELLQEQTRELALLAVGEWESLALTGFGDLLPSLAALEHPTWGTWNGLLQALRTARDQVLASGGAAARAQIEHAAGLAQILAFWDRPAEAGQPTFAEAIGQALGLANRLTYGAPPEPTWWTQAESVVRPLVRYLASDPLANIRAQVPRRAPWFVQEPTQVWSFQGRAPDFSAVYTAPGGATRTVPPGDSGLAPALGRLLGTFQEQALRRLLARQAPEELRGVLLGDFLVGRPVGEGGFGSVHVGRQLSTGRKVALKLLHDGMPPEIKDRFQREAAYLARFNQPNIVSVLAYGEARWSLSPLMDLSQEAWFAAFAASAPVKSFIAMEWVEGQTLETVYQQAKRDPAARPPIRTLADWFAQAAGALQAVHAAGLVHRDVKPGNLMVTAEGTVKLMDFGIARLQAPERTLVTTPGRVFGTLMYMSPEQIRAAEAESRVGPGTDIYSLCATFYELFTLTRLYGHDSQSVETVKTLKLTGQRPQPPRKQARELPWELEVILLGGLEAEVTDRYRSMEALARDLRHFLADEPIAYRRPSLLRRGQLAYRRHRIPLNTAAAVTLVAAAGLLYWWQLPGTLHLRIRPVGARIEIAGQTLTATEQPIPLRLRSGVYHVRVRAPDYHDPTDLQGRSPAAMREVHIGRLQDKDLTVALAHDQGALVADSSPAGSTIEINGMPYGSPIARLPLDTGAYQLTAWTDEHFESRRTLELAAGQNTSLHFWLEKGTGWTYASSAIQSGLVVFPNLKIKGAPVIAHNELEQITFLSTADGSVLARIPTPTGNQRTFLEADVGGPAGQLLLSGLDQERTGPELLAIKSSGTPQVLWHWQGPATGARTPQSLAIAVTPRQGGLADLAVAGRDGRIYIIDGQTGKTLRQWSIADQPLPAPPALSPLDVDGQKLLVLTRPGDPAKDPSASDLVAAAMATADGAVTWRQNLGPQLGAFATEPIANAAQQLVLWNSQRWQILDPATGQSGGSGPLPAALIGGPVPVALDATPALLLQFADPARPMLAVRIADGQTLWQGPAHLSTTAQPRGPGNAPLRTATGQLVVALENALAALDPRTGAIAWQVPGKPRGVLTLPSPGSSDHLLVAMLGKGLLCLDAAGHTLWTLRLSQDVDPWAVLPAGPGESPDILIHRHAGMIGLVHQPRLLWQAQAAGPVQATPAVTADAAGKPLIVQLAPWGNEVRLCGLDPASGAVRWSASDTIAPNRAPALADLDGTPALIAIGTPAGQQDNHLLVYRAADGALLRSPRVAIPGWLSCTPAVADFRGTRQRDVAVTTWDDRSIILLDGRTGATLWRHPTDGPNLGSLAAADLDGDGLPDVLAASGDGFLYALRGKDGKMLWKAPLGEGGSQANPTLADLDGKPRVLIVSTTGQLHVLDAASGAALWAPEIPGGLKASGQPAVARVGQQTLVLAPLGQAGVVAFDWSRRTEIWRSPRGFPVIATPVLAELAEKDHQQVLVASLTGDVFILDLANGRQLWHRKVAEDLIEADPLLANLRGQGPDLLIASHDRRLHVLPGRPIADTIRAWRARP